MPKTLDLENIVDASKLGTAIAGKWSEWDSLRSQWKQEKKELRNFLYATDTRTTTVGKLPWANSTTTPKLTQIYDNLKANYEAALFPNSNWVRWEADTQDSETKEKVRSIQGYIKNKLTHSGFRTEASKLIDDYILYGNCFASEEWVSETRDESVGYVGPKTKRISPFDIVFDPTAREFKDSPKILRALMNLGDFKKTYGEDFFDDMLGARAQVSAAAEVEKSDGYVADGFSSIQHYYGSGYVEVLTFYGSIYDEITGDFLDHRKIVVADRAYVISNEPIAEWLGNAPIFHAGWRTRPDNLWAMGPLDNLVGLQYRMDHLENLKADVFDQIALPMIKVVGNVEEFEQRPGERIYIGEEGDVGYLTPDGTALNADFQIQQIQQTMEEMAGAPRQAMGIRTPGEKTAYEVSSLENAAGRIFQHKASKFEVEFIEPILNAKLASARQNMTTGDTIKVLDPETNHNMFLSVTKEDIIGNGKIVPVGARHFAERAQRIQNLNGLISFKNDPTVSPHFSGKKIAEILAEELGEPDIYAENIAIQEQQETQQLMQDAEADNMERQQIQAEEGL